MGKCISKGKSPKLEAIRSRREESIFTPVHTEGVRNIVYSVSSPALIKSNEVIETQIELNSKGSKMSENPPSISHPSHHSRNASKFSIS